MAGKPASTSAPAYEDLERFSYARHRTVSPYTVLELLAPRERDGDEGVGSFRPAGETLRRWLRTGVLTVDPQPALYVYEEHELRHGVPAVQRGLLAAVRLPEAGRSAATQGLLSHEQVDDARVRERLARLQSVPVDLSPVFAVHLDPPEELRLLLDRRPRAAPVLACTDEAGIDHRVWAMRDPDDVATVRRCLAALPAIIADGHHRHAAALAYRDRHRPGPPSAGAERPWERTLTYLVDAGRHGPEVRAVQRLLRRAPEDLMRRLDRRLVGVHVRGSLSRLGAALGDLPGPAVGLWRASGGLLLRPRDESALATRARAGGPRDRPLLDADVLEHVVLPALGPSTGEDTVELRSDTAAAAAEVDAGLAAALLVLRPVPLPVVFAAAAGGQPLPPKSTYFRPKPRTGLVMRPVVEDLLRPG